MRENVAVKRAPGPEAKSSAENVVKTFLHSVETGKRSDQPYLHWILKGCLPPDSVDDVLALPFEAGDQALYLLCKASRPVQAMLEAPLLFGLGDSKRAVVKLGDSRFEVTEVVLHFPEPAL